MRHAEYPAAERVLLHLSDTHLRARGRDCSITSTRRSGLVRALEAIEASGIAPDGVVFTGDLADLRRARCLRASSEPSSDRSPRGSAPACSG